MSRRLGLALVCLAACTPRGAPLPAGESPDSALATETVDAAAEVSDEAPDAGPPIDLGSDGGFASLLSGAVPANRLPEVATDHGAELDRDLRLQLTTVEVPDPPEATGEARTPKATVTVDGVSSTSATSDAKRVVAASLPRARACYHLGLLNDPTMAGKLVITAAVGANGQVSDATVAQNLGLSASVATCLAQTFRDATFAPPAGGVGATLTIPLTLASGS